ncbi:MAG: D-aminoacyl-tRNA deacylase [bacterium]|nr:D-aminoacyl-tRNA deacylase [bacterium]
MRAVVQRVSRAQVHIEGQLHSAIGTGLLVLLGVEETDTLIDVKYMAEKVCGLRIFSDGEGKMNLSVADVEGSVLVVSQFTLHGDCRKGRRPSYSSAAAPVLAEKLYQEFVTELSKYGTEVSTGVFRAMMQVSSVNEGPVTLLIDSRKAF